MYHSLHVFTFHFLLTFASHTFIPTATSKHFQPTIWTISAHPVIRVQMASVLSSRELCVHVTSELDWLQSSPLVLLLNLAFQRVHMPGFLLPALVVFLSGFSWTQLLFSVSRWWRFPGTTLQKSSALCLGSVSRRAYLGLESFFWIHGPRLSVMKLCRCRQSSELSSVIRDSWFVTSVSPETSRLEHISAPPTLLPSVKMAPSLISAGLQTVKTMSSCLIPKQTLLCHQKLEFFHELLS